MKCIDEWDRIYREEGEVYMWASIGASALVTALIACVVIELIQKFK